MNHPRKRQKQNTKILKLYRFLYLCQRTHQKKKKKKGESKVPPVEVKQGRETNRFQRVRAEEIEFTDNRLADNSFATKGETWGNKASKDLIAVRGDRFRHEKTKKKAWVIQRYRN